MDPAPGHARPPASEPDRRGAERGLGPRHPRRRRRRRADPHLAWTNPAAAADAAWATSDTLHVAAAMLGSRILRQAADAYDRAARTPYGRIPPPTPAGNQLRQAARLLSAFAYLTGDRSMAPIVLITRLAALAEAVAELRESQQHAAQAAAAARRRTPVRRRPPGLACTAARPCRTTAADSLRCPFRPRSTRPRHRPSMAPTWPIGGHRAGPSSHGRAAPPADT